MRPHDVTDGPAFAHPTDAVEARIEAEALAEAPVDGKDQVSPAIEESVLPDFSIVGIGASAGGLEALGALLKRLTPHSMAFVVVQHLAPDHDSMLTELLARSTSLKVLTAQEGMKVHPGHIYVTPPKAELTIVRGVLHVNEPHPGQRPHLPVNSFFRSLAEDWGTRAIGIVLSGTGSDGTLGLQSIKGAGGITFAQEPSSAKSKGCR